MNAERFPDAVADRTRTALDRLGSSKRLVAITGADLTTPTVLARAAASEAAAADTFDALAAAADTDAAAAACDSFAATERDHYDRVTAALDADDADTAADPGAVHDYLRERPDDTTRLGAVVGRGLVADRTLAQFVGFFVNDAAHDRADLFRDLRRDTSADTADAAAALASCCDGDDDWARAADAAADAVDAAYQEYVAALNGMGVDAKSVC
ncbi:rubrerythrin family protein [Halobacterium sp. MBLA0001]|uniref:rubrerythrin family protein n=1 Tax=Halobacterium sp. MBLA0001 TaxID=3413511 RepID=UPI003C7668F4